jgi:hypothetical protein
MVRNDTDRRHDVGAGRYGKMVRDKVWAESRVRGLGTRYLR